MNETAEQQQNRPIVAYSDLSLSLSSIRKCLFAGVEIERSSES